MAKTVSSTKPQEVERMFFRRLIHWSPSILEMKGLSNAPLPPTVLLPVPPILTRHPVVPVRRNLMSLFNQTTDDLPMTNTTNVQNSVRSILESDILTSDESEDESHREARERKEFIELNQLDPSVFNLSPEPTSFTFLSPMTTPQSSPHSSSQSTLYPSPLNLTD